MEKPYSKKHLFCNTLWKCFCFRELNIYHQNLVQPNQSHSNISMMANAFIPWHNCTATLLIAMNLVSFADDSPQNISYPAKINCVCLFVCLCVLSGGDEGRHKPKSLLSVVQKTSALVCFLASRDLVHKYTVLIEWFSKAKTVECRKCKECRKSQLYVYLYVQLSEVRTTILLDVLSVTLKHTVIVHVCV